MSEDLSWAVRAAGLGDEEAFNLLYTAVQPGMLRYLRVLVGADAEDVASETWLHIVRDLSTFRGDDIGFRRWSISIARHRALDLLRLRQRRATLPAEMEDLAELPAADDTATAALQVLTTEDALALIARLPQDQAEAVLLRVVVGLDSASAAQVLDKRSGAVRMAAHRGLRRLAELLDGVPATPATGEMLKEKT